MKRIARKEGKDVWLDVPARPYRVIAPVVGKVFVCALFVADPGITDDERADISSQLVAAGCRYAVCAGLKCSEWDDSIDVAHLETDPNFDPLDETFVMTTWHEGGVGRRGVGVRAAQHQFRRPHFRAPARAGARPDARLQLEIAAALAA